MVSLQEISFKEMLPRWRRLLVAAAETLGDQTVFTLDGCFLVYRLASGAAFDVVPKWRLFPNGPAPR
jgi:hypothetical protein